MKRSELEEAVQHLDRRWVRVDSQVETEKSLGVLLALAKEVLGAKPVKTRYGFLATEKGEKVIPTPLEED